MKLPGAPPTAWQRLRENQPTFLYSEVRRKQDRQSASSQKTNVSHYELNEDTQRDGDTDGGEAALQQRDEVSEGGLVEQDESGWKGTMDRCKH